MEKPLFGSREPELLTMMLPSEQNPGEHEEHFMFQDPAYPSRRAVVKQEFVDVAGRANLKDQRAILRGEAFD